MSRPVLRLVDPAHAATLDQGPTGPPQALELREVFRTHSAYVATLAFRLLGRDGEIDDVVQEVFLSALSGLRRLQSPRAVRSWLATVTARKVARRIRGRRLRALFFRAPVDVDYEAIASPDADPEQRAQVARLYAALDGMPAAERVAWALRHVEGERLEDVARLTGCSLATAKRRIASAQRRLERTWSDEGDDRLAEQVAGAPRLVRAAWDEGRAYRVLARVERARHLRGVAR